MLSGAGPGCYSQHNGNRRPNDEFEGSSFMGHREILALTYPKRKMPPSAESGKCAKPLAQAWQSLVRSELLSVTRFWLFYP